MKNSIPSLALAVCTALVAGPVLAQAEVLSPGSHEFTEYGKSGPWTIYKDHDRKSCLIEHVDGNGTAIQMGLTSNHSIGYVGVFTNRDVGMPEVENTDITIQVNGNTYTGRSQEMKHRLSDGYKGGYFLANNPNFVNDMKNGTQMVALGDKTREGVKISLTGTNAAIDEAAKCTQSMM